MERVLQCFKHKKFNIQTERRLLVILICYGIVITLLHLVNIQTIFLIQPKTLQFIQKNSVYLGSRCFGCDDLIQNGVEKKNLYDIELLLAIPSQGLAKFENYFFRQIPSMNTYSCFLSSRDGKIVQKSLIFSFLHQNCKFCETIISFSKVDHFARRMWIRETWGQIQPSLFKRKAVFFFLGKSTNQSVNEAVRRENQRYRDIVQAGKRF